MQPDYDIVIRNGTIYNGSGQAPFKGDVTINHQEIVRISPDEKGKGRVDIDVDGLAVAPGFINVMSWAPISSIIDGKSQSDIRQGITLEVFGEAWSEGPLNETMRQEQLAQQSDFFYDIPWSTLGEFLEYLVARGVSTNIASYLGASTLRIYALGYDNRPPKPDEMDLMRTLTRQAMEEGALGLSSALIYPPGCYAKTSELIELAKIVSQYNGIYISHLRSEGNTFEEGLEELLTIAREANIRSEIYHLKAMGEQNWHKMDKVIEKVQEARQAGLQITADMYTYTAGETGLGAAMPPWVQEGGLNAWIERLKDPIIRQKLHYEISTPSSEWENIFLMAGKPENMILAGFNKEHLKEFQGKTIAEVALARGQNPIDTIIDLVIEDQSNVGVVYFIMSEDNLRKQIKLPWVCIGSDAASLAPEGVFLNSYNHPRAYGTFAKYLGKYVRDEGLIPLEEAIRKITSFPAENLKITKRGRLAAGYYGDVVVFDPQTIQDHATYQQPNQYATGIKYVWVNGVQVLKDGEHTGALPGMIVRGPGYKRE